MKAIYLSFLAVLMLQMSKGQACFCTFQAGSCTIQPGSNDRCQNGDVCPCNELPQNDCPDGSATCVPPGGTGDPHFLGFDGSSFYFHGVHGHSYLIHGTRNGDSLVARVRATNELYMDVNMTYFEEFGLKLGSSSHSIRFYLQKGEQPGWKVNIEVNGVVISSNQRVGKSSIKIHSAGRKYIVITPSNKFIIQGVSLNSKYRRHLDFQVQIRNVLEDQLFTGILGRTVNKRIAYRIRKTDTVAKKKEFEFKMRELYDVPSLFPSYESSMKRQFVASDVHKTA